jgi:hypothetical protein
MIHVYALMIQYEKQDQVYKQECKFIVVQRT